MRVLESLPPGFHAEARTVAPWPATDRRGPRRRGAWRRDPSAGPSKTVTSWMERRSAAVHPPRPGEQSSAPPRASAPPREPAAQRPLPAASVIPSEQTESRDLHTLIPKCGSLDCARDDELLCRGNVIAPRPDHQDDKDRQQRHPRERPEDE